MVNLSRCALQLSRKALTSLGCAFRAAEYSSQKLSHSSSNSKLQLFSSVRNTTGNNLSFTHHSSPEQQSSRLEVGTRFSFAPSAAVKTKLREIPDACVSYKQLLELCTDCTKRSSQDEGKDIIKSLEQSGDVLRIGQTVYLHPQQITRAVNDVLALCVNEGSRKEFLKLEKEKAEIDVESERLVRKEFLGGLGFLIVSSVGLFRLTFWEFSWDVMEPICFFVTSVYFILGYGFFLKTKMEPSFNILYAARLKARRSRFIKERDFNLERYTELQRICCSRESLEESN